NIVFYETSLEVPFSGAVIVDGGVDANLDNLQKSSQLLTVEERTIPIEGVLAVTASTKSSSTRSDKGVSDADCQDIQNGDSPAYRKQYIQYVGHGANSMTTTLDEKKRVKTASSSKPSKVALTEPVAPFNGVSGGIC